MGAAAKSCLEFVTRGGYLAAPPCILSLCYWHGIKLRGALGDELDNKSGWPTQKRTLIHFCHLTCIPVYQYVYLYHTKGENGGWEFNMYKTAGRFCVCKSKNHYNVWYSSRPFEIEEIFACST